MNIKTIKKAEELLELKDETLRYEFDNFIKVEKFGERRLSQKKLKLLWIIDPVIQTIIEEEEIVYFVTDGLRVSTFEQLFIGHVVYYYNLTAFVFTSKRILLIHLKSKKKRGVYIGNIEYADINKVSSSLLGSLLIKFRNGKSLTFAKVPRKDRKYLKEFLNSIVDTTAQKDKSAKGIRNLCQKCFVEIEGIPRNCPSCNIEFKSPKKAAVLSFIMPGLGDLYLGSRVLGTIELLFMLYIWAVLITSALEEVGAGASMGITLLSLLIIFLIIHPLDALKANYVGKKGLIPKVAIKYEGE